MRQIKFRAWCKITNGYLVQEKENTQIKSLDGLFSQLEFNERNYGDNFVLEQFTGLQDKNGVDIYEGDVVESKDNFNPSVVNFQDGSFYFWDLPVTDGLDYTWEVIGNIHENPELCTN